MRSVMVFYGVHLLCKVCSFTVMCETCIRFQLLIAKVDLCFIDMSLLERFS